MKNAKQPFFYFSAYPLKSIGQVSPDALNESPLYKKILGGKTKTLSRIGILPMVNPYKENVSPISSYSDKTTNETETNNETTNSEWFNNYE